MIGLVLWHNPTAEVGVVWCEDQGPLAFLGPEVGLPEGSEGLQCGDQLILSIETRDGVRYVREIFAVMAGDGTHDPREILAGYHRDMAAAPNIRIVA